MHHNHYPPFSISPPLYTTRGSGVSPGLEANDDAQTQFYPTLSICCGYTGTHKALSLSLTLSRSCSLPLTKPCMCSFVNHLKAWQMCIGSFRASPWKAFAFVSHPHPFSDTVVLYWLDTLLGIRRALLVAQFLSAWVCSTDTGRDKCNEKTIWSVSVLIILVFLVFQRLVAGQPEVFTAAEPKGHW